MFINIDEKKNIKTIDKVPIDKVTALRIKIS